ncbi:MAG: F0F1 ATP synthase subunit A [Thermoleophilia bacterium]|nr:F0F1 ATP synthase subunit A [Thermoleophilia bacterium]
MSTLVLAAADEFDPSHEFELPAWVPLHLGPLDLSINKAVAYLWLGGLVTILFGIWFMRFGLSLRPSRRQTTGESLYDLMYGQIVEGNVPGKARGTWFPYVAALFLFIWIVNLLGFVPLPISDERWHVAGLSIPTLAIYAATANLSVTLALALITFVATHVEGVRYNGFGPYLRSWIPQGAPKPLLGLIVPLEVISQFMRLISLSVRLFANMLAGHMLILVMIGLIFIFSAWWLVPFSVAIGTVIYLFEVVIVVTIQAFVFALLSAIYIGGAIAPEH